MMRKNEKKRTVKTKIRNTEKKRKNNCEKLMEAVVLSDMNQLERHSFCGSKFFFFFLFRINNFFISFLFISFFIPFLLMFLSKKIIFSSFCFSCDLILYSATRFITRRWFYVAILYSLNRISSCSSFSFLNFFFTFTFVLK